MTSSTKTIACIILLTTIAGCASQPRASSGREIRPTQSHPGGYLAAPVAGKGTGVLVLHAWWGLNDTIKAFCLRLADAGFVAFAPDLYHGKVARTIPEAEALGHALDEHYVKARAEVRAATRFLVSQSVHSGQVAVMGFSLGAFYALDAAVQDPNDIHSVVVFYGTGGPMDFSRSKAAFMGHFAEKDPYNPPVDVDALESALEKAKRPATFYHYPGTGHWFVEPDVKGAYNESAASLAWKRTLRFLKERASMPATVR